MRWVSIVGLNHKLYVGRFSCSPPRDFNFIIVIKEKSKHGVSINLELKYSIPTFLHRVDFGAGTNSLVAFYG